MGNVWAGNPLQHRVQADQIEAMRSVLIALTQIKAQDLATGAGRPRPPRQLRKISPVFSVRDLEAALAHYTALGFDTVPYANGDEYGSANRDGLGLHLAVHEAQDHTHSGSAYLYVRDADELYEEWARPGIGGHTFPVGPTIQIAGGVAYRPGWQLDPFRVTDRGLNEARKSARRTQGWRVLPKRA